MGAGKRGHPLFERFYAWLSPRMEKEGVGEFRERLLDGLIGRVVEVGAGNGLNFSHYPSDVDHVLAVEPAPYLRSLAEEAAREAAVDIEVVEGDAERLPAADGSADAGIASLVLCSVPDQGRALKELFRVIKPGGELRFFEHVRSDTRVLRSVQRVMDATVWPRLAGGCHTTRDTAAAIERAGFQIEKIERFRFPESFVAPPSAPHVLGSARRPAP